jgi:multidrug efflux pump subunit AcrA (membrane-fusion protein)
MNKKDDLKMFAEELQSLLQLMEHQKQQFLSDFDTLKGTIDSFNTRLKQVNQLTEIQQAQLIEEIQAFLDEFDEEVEFDEEEGDSVEELQSYLETLLAILDQTDEASLPNKKALQSSLRSILARFNDIDSLSEQEQETVLDDAYNFIEELHSALPAFNEDEMEEDFEESDEEEEEKPSKSSKSKNNKRQK